MQTNKLIASDLDGTLFYPKARMFLIKWKTKKFLRRFIDDGGRLVVVSGRSRYVSGKVAKVLRRKVDIIGCTGAFIVSDGAVIREKFFDVAFSKRLLGDIQKQYDPPLVILMTRDRNMIINRKGVSAFTTFCYYVYQWSEGVYCERFIRSDKAFNEEIEKGDVYKIMVMFGLTKKKQNQAKEANKLFRETYPEAEFSWVGPFIEITPKGCSKSESLAFYLEHRGVNADNVLVVGDSGNDISMFLDYPKSSFCMSHAPENVRKRAAYTIDRFPELGRFIYPSEEKKEQ